MTGSWFYTPTRGKGAGEPFSQEKGRHVYRTFRRQVGPTNTNTHKVLSPVCVYLSSGA